MICGRCYEATEKAPCMYCGEDPLVKGRYRLEERVGSGASGFTWRGWDCEKERAVAVKEVSLKRVRGLKEWELFEREARVLESLEAAGIPRFEEMFILEEPRRVEVYLVMEWIEAPPLSLERPWEEGEVLGFLEAMAEVLEGLGDRHPPVVHRDIKPSNVLGESGGPYWLIDFGATARLRNATLPGSTVAGSYGYMAPEQLRGEASPGSDIYGLGATAAALLAGKEAEELLDHRGRLDLSEQIRISRPLEVLLESMIEEDRDRRLGDAGELRGALRRCRRELEGGWEGNRRLQAEPPRMARWHVRAMAWMNRGLGGAGAAYMGALVGYIFGFMPFALLALLPASWILGSWVWGLYFSVFSFDGSHFNRSHLFASAVMIGVIALGPEMERRLRGLPEVWKEWRSMARWGGRLRSRERLLRKGGAARGLRLATAAGAASMAFLGAQHLILTLILSFPGVFSWAPSKVLAGLTAVGVFLPIFLITEGLSKKRGSGGERFLPGGAGIWPDRVSGKVEEAVEILSRHVPEKEALERARKIREGLVCGGRWERMQREVLWLLDLGARGEREWERALRYVERCTESSPELVRALDWVSEGLAGMDRELSLRVYQAARAHEKFDDEEEEVILDLGESNAGEAEEREEREVQEDESVWEEV